jgi:putative Holliday junction resolvase
MGKILAVDYGTKRLGLALSDEERQWAFGRGVVAVHSDAQAIAAIEKILKQEEVEKIVLGLPLTLRGEDDGKMATKIQDFACTLEEATGVSVDFEDERLSSEAAHTLARDAGRDAKKPVDEQAAILLLESYLHRTRHARNA